MSAAKTPEQYEAEAAKRMEGFTFTRIGHTPALEGWLCQKPGTSIYGFELVVSRWGMAMYGDVDGLLWRVGSDYGIKFLAHYDIGYIRSKLEHQCQEDELDREALKGVVAEALCEQIAQDPITLPAFFKDVHHYDKHWDDLRAWLQKSDDLNSERYFMDRILEVDNAHAAYQMLDDENTVEGLLGGNLDLSDIHITRPAEDLIQRLFMVRRAARAILEIKQKEAA